MQESAFFSLVPTTWNCYGKPSAQKNGKIELSRYDREFDEIENIFNKVGMEVRRIVRHEQIYKYMQFLVRQQHLLALNPNQVYYKARRFVRLDDEDLNDAVKYHLDQRRVPSIKFRNNPTSGSGDVIIITSVITDSPNTDYYVPDRDSNYIIEYVVYLDY